MINSFQDGERGFNTTSTLLEAELEMRKEIIFVRKAFQSSE